MDPESFYLPDGDAYKATELTRGPWSRDHQHGGPPAALMARAMEHAAGDGVQLARITVEFLRPVPIGRLTLETELSRSGRKVQELAARLSYDGQEVARARAIAISRRKVELPALPPRTVPLPGPEESASFDFPFFLEAVGYHTAMEVRIARGTFGQGPVAAWMRMRHPLLPGEAPSPLVRVAIAADSGNGVSVVLDVTRYTFINPDLGVYLHRMPEGEWICLDARTTPGQDGIGLAVSDLYDTGGAIGHGLQTLVVDQRDG